MVKGSLYTGEISVNELCTSELGTCEFAIESSVFCWVNRESTNLSVIFFQISLLFPFQPHGEAGLNVAPRAICLDLATSPRVSD